MNFISPSRKHLGAVTVLYFFILLAAGCGPTDEEKTSKTVQTPAQQQLPTKAQQGKKAKLPKPETLAKKVERIHKEAIVFDAHCDSLMGVTDDDIDLGKRLKKGHIDFPRMREGGLDVQVFAVWVSPHFWPDKAKKRALEMIDGFERTVKNNPDVVEHALTIFDAQRIVKSGKIAAFLGIEGGHAIEDDIKSLEMFYKKGVRYMTLTWWNNTNWADGSGDKPKWHGLNKLGREVVKEMNRLGMIIDISHVSDETFWDVLEITNSPVIASHSNARAVSDHHRNLSDKMLRALAKNGGVVGINFAAGFLDSNFHKESKKLKKKLKPRLDEIEKKYPNDKRRAGHESWMLYKKEAKTLTPIGIEKVIDHIDHVVKIAGIDHVGIGSDFDGFAVSPAELTDCSKFPLITEKLLERGYSEEDVDKVMGDNFLRVFKTVID